MSIEADGSIRHQVTVGLDQEQAFWAFADLDRIKPREHNLLAVPIRRTVIEPRAGGDIYDEGVDGSTCRWGRVLAFEPPSRITFSWDIGPDWRIADDLTRTSEVEVTFTPDGPSRASVVLVHRHLSRHGTGWEAARDGLDTGDGWPLYLARYEALTLEGTR